MPVSHSIRYSNDSISNVRTIITFSRPFPLSYTPFFSFFIFLGLSHRLCPFFFFSFFSRLFYLSPASRSRSLSCCLRSFIAVLFLPYSKSFPRNRPFLSAPGSSPLAMNYHSSFSSVFPLVRPATTLLFTILFRHAVRDMVRQKSSQFLH